LEAGARVVSHEGGDFRRSCGGTQELWSEASSKNRTIMGLRILRCFAVTFTLSCMIKMAGKTDADSRILRDDNSVHFEQLSRLPPALPGFLELLILGIAILVGYLGTGEHCDEPC
jgi:hypothetical protein